MPVRGKRQQTVSRQGSSLLACTWLLSCLALGCLALHGLFGGQGERGSAANLVKALARADVALAVSDSPYVTKSIRDIRIGERVLAYNPEVTDQERRQAIEPDSSWRHIQLEMEKADNSVLKIELLRPREWVVSHHAYTGTTIHLDLEEMGASGPARVVSIGRAPPIAKGSGEVVTGTFSHSAGNVINLYVDGLDQPLGTTDNHPFWSEDRQTFIPAGDLQTGERLRTENGNLIAVSGSSSRAADAVFNLEVNTEHVYYISASGFLVHNSYVDYDGPVYHGTDDISAGSIRNGLDYDKWQEAAGGAGVDPKGFSVTTNRSTAEAWAIERARERGGLPVVLEANGSSLPIQGGSSDDLVDPDEFFISPDDFLNVGPGVFQ